MVIFTDEQVDAALKRLDRLDEIFDRMCEVAGNLADEKRSLEREVERLNNRLKSTEEELAMAQKALANSYAQTVTQYQLILNDFGRMKKETHNDQATDSSFSWSVSCG